jgi:hypothetical protein
MTGTFVCRVAPLTVGLTLVLNMAPAASHAALDMVVGARQVVKNEPVSACNSKARDALNSVLTDAAEVGAGDTGEWKAYSAPDASGHSSAAAAIHCYPLDDVSGYLVTFTCAAQVPPNADSAAVLCTKLTQAFGGGKAQAQTAPPRVERQT